MEVHGSFCNPIKQNMPELTTRVSLFSNNGVKLVLERNTGNKKLKRSLSKKWRLRFNRFERKLKPFVIHSQTLWEGQNMNSIDSINKNIFQFITFRLVLSRLPVLFSIRSAPLKELWKVNWETIGVTVAGSVVPFNESSPLSCSIFSSFKTQAPTTHSHRVQWNLLKTD